MTGKCDRIIKIDNFKWYELPIKWMMMLFGWTGYTAPYRYIYFIEVPSRRLKKHECKHAEQMSTSGALKYHAVYLYHFLKGLVYWRSFKLAYLEIPYEIEAREAEDE